MTVDKFELLKAEYLGKLEGAAEMVRRLRGTTITLGFTAYTSQLMVDFAREARTLGEELADAEWRAIVKQEIARKADTADEDHHLSEGA